MNSENDKNIQSSFHRVGMTAFEKRVTKLSLLARINLYSQTTPQRIVSPYFFRIVVAALLVVIFIATGFSSAVYASQDSLPGEFLYPLKVDVLEEIQGYLTNGEEAEAEYAVGLLEERLEEMDALIESGQYSHEAQEDLFEEIEENVESGLDELDDLPENSIRTLVLYSELETILQTQALVVSLKENRGILPIFFSNLIDVVDAEQEEVVEEILVDGNRDDIGVFIDVQAQELSRNIILDDHFDARIISSFVEEQFIVAEMGVAEALDQLERGKLRRGLEILVDTGELVEALGAADEILEG